MSDSDTDTERKSPSVPKYKGDFNTWYIAIKAYATVNNCHRILASPRVGDPTKDYYSLGETSEMQGTEEEKKKMLEYLIKNAKMINALHRAFEKHPALERKVQLTISPLQWPKWMRSLS